MRNGQVGGGIGIARLDQLDELVVLVGGELALWREVELPRVVEGHADAGVVDQEAAQAGRQVFESAISPMIEWKRSLPSARSAASPFLIAWRKAH